MSGQQPANNSLNISIGGSVTGDVVGLGVNVHQQKQIETTPQPTPQPGITEAEIMELVSLLTQLKAQVAAEALPAHKEVALEWVKELESAVTAEKPDLTRLERVKQWFAKYLPAVSGAVASVVIHPIVGKLVEATGDALATNLRQHLEP
jgi:hypothetical protein